MNPTVTERSFGPGTAQSHDDFWSTVHSFSKNLHRVYLRFKSGLWVSSPVSALVFDLVNFTISVLSFYLQMFFASSFSVPQNPVQYRSLSPTCGLILTLPHTHPLRSFSQWCSSYDTFVNLTQRMILVLFINKKLTLMDYIWCLLTPSGQNMEQKDVWKTVKEKIFFYKVGQTLIHMKFQNCFKQTHTHTHCRHRCGFISRWRVSVQQRKNICSVNVWFESQRI